MTVYIEEGRACEAYGPGKGGGGGLNIDRLTLDILEERVGDGEARLDFKDDAASMQYGHVR